ncbi:hypothetical protein LBMAG53_10410 [Planctomycetota bacterium]|nr:hypothetical protein LBMAG53_10410 [Planctomycetota bacterium]
MNPVALLGQVLLIAWSVVVVAAAVTILIPAWPFFGVVGSLCIVAWVAAILLVSWWWPRRDQGFHLILAVLGAFMLTMAWLPDSLADVASLLNLGIWAGATGFAVYFAIFGGRTHRYIAVIAGLAVIALLCNEWNTAYINELRSDQNAEEALRKKIDDNRKIIAEAKAAVAARKAMLSGKRFAEDAATDELDLSSLNPADRKILEDKIAAAKVAKEYLLKQNVPEEAPEGSSQPAGSSTAGETSGDGSSTAAAAGTGEHPADAGAPSPAAASASAPAVTSSGEPEEPAWKKARGKQTRAAPAPSATSGSATASAAAKGPDTSRLADLATSAKPVGVTGFTSADIAAANQLDLLNRFAVRTSLLFVLIVAIAELLRANNRLPTTLPPLPLSRSWIDMIFPRPDAGLVDADAGELCRRLIGRGEGLFYIGVSDPLATDQVARPPIPALSVLTVDAVGGPHRDPPWMLGVAWAVRSAVVVVVGGGAGGAARAESLLESLTAEADIRRTILARANPTLNLVWDLPTVPPRHLTDRLLFIGGGIGIRLLIIDHGSVPEPLRERLGDPVSA